MMALSRKWRSPGMKRVSYRRQAGDTIVEVLIAIGIISLVLTAAFVTANRSYKTMQDAQEKGNALKLLERETEALKAFSTTGGSALANAVSLGTPFCMVLDASGNPQLATNNNLTDGTNPCLLAPNATQAPAGTVPAYSIRISKSPVAIGSGTLFVTQAKWDSILGDGKNQVQIEYGVYP